MFVPGECEVCLLEGRLKQCAWYDGRAKDTMNFTKMFRSLFPVKCLTMIFFMIINFFMPSHTDELKGKYIKCTVYVR